MSINSSNIIEKPVSVDDIVTVLNAGQKDFTHLFQSQRINPFSRRKPVVASTNNELSENDFKAIHYGLTDISFTKMFKSLVGIPLSNIFTSGMAISELGYQKPSANLRISDFDSYNHNASEPFQTQIKSAIISNNVSMMPDTWCYSPVMDALRRKRCDEHPGESSYQYSLNAVVNASGGLHPNNEVPKIMKLEYDYQVSSSSTQTRYRTQQLYNVIQYDTWLDTITNPSPTDNLTFEDIGLSSDANYNWENYSFALLINVKNKYYLYNTKFTLAQMYTGGTSNNWSRLKYDLTTTQNPDPYIVLAQKTSTSFDIYIHPWVLSTDLTYNQSGYYEKSGGLYSSNIFGANNVVDGDIVKTRLCLVPTQAGETVSNSYFKEITEVPANTYACEFPKTPNIKSLTYYSGSFGHSTIPMGTWPSTREIFDGISTFHSGARYHGDFLKNGTNVSKEIYDSEQDVYKWDIIELLTYVKCPTLFYYYKNQNLITPSQGADTFSLLGGNYQIYTTTPHTSSTSTNIVSEGATIEYTINVQSPSIPHQFWSDYQSGTQITSNVDGRNGHNYCFNVKYNSGIPSNSVTMQYDYLLKTYEGSSTNIVDCEGAGATDCLYSEHNTTISGYGHGNYVDKYDSSTNQNIFVGSTSNKLTHWYVFLNKSNFNNSTVDITVTLDGIGSYTTTKTFTELFGTQS